MQQHDRSRRKDAPSSTSSSAQLAPALSSTAAAAASMLARRRAPEGKSGKRELFCRLKARCWDESIVFVKSEWRESKNEGGKKEKSVTSSFSSSFPFSFHLLVYTHTLHALLTPALPLSSVFFPPSRRCGSSSARSRAPTSRCTPATS